MAAAWTPICRLLLAPCLLAGCLPIGCGGEPTPPDGAPHIVLVTLDTTRADRLGAYGYQRDTSPVFDALAEDSLLFERAIVPMATTLPTHVSILTATHPLEHGVLANSTQGGRRFVPSATLHSFAALARDAGWATAAFVSAAPLKRGSGVEAGFETFDEPADKHRSGEATTDAAIAWLDAHRQRPFFLWVHYYDAHWPFEPPPPYDTMFEVDDALESWLAARRFTPRVFRPLPNSYDEAPSTNNAYDGELRYQDAQLGRLLSALRQRGLWERTALIVAGDHGESLCQHGEAAHGGTWDEQLHAPLLLRVPGGPARRIASPVSVYDALPTLLGLLDVPVLSELLAQASGRDALATERAPLPVLSQDTGRLRDAPYRHALTTARWKYFRIEGQDGSVSELLFDLANDPFELRDLSAERPEVTQRFRAALSAELAARTARGELLRGGEAPRTREEDPAVIEQLRALGYLEPVAEDPDA